MKTDPAIGQTVFIISKLRSEMLFNQDHFDTELPAWVTALEEYRDGNGVMEMRERVIDVAETLERAWAILADKDLIDDWFNTCGCWDFDWIPAMLNAADDKVLTWSADEFVSATAECRECIDQANRDPSPELVESAKALREESAEAV